MIKFKQGWPLKKSENSRLSPVLQGFRVILSAPCWDDYADWSRVRTANQNFLTPYEPQWAEDSLTHEFFKRRLERQDIEVREGRACYFFIRHKETQKIIGGLNLNNIQMGAARQASLGYWIDKDHEGQSYMKEAITLVIDYAFKTLKLKRLNAACLPENKRSIGLLKSLSFEEEGYAKKYLQINGSWQDHKLFGLVADQAWPVIEESWEAFTPKLKSP